MKNWIKHFLFTLIPTIRRNSIEVKFDSIIEDFINRCGDHHLVTRPRVLNWIQQFDDESLIIPEKILTKLKYYSSATLTIMTDNLIKIITTNLGCNKDDIYYVPIGGAGSGAQNIARAIRNNKRVNPVNVVNLHELYVNRAAEVHNKHLILIDDFSGSGKTIKEWFEMNEPLIYPFNANLSIALLVLNHKAEEKVRKLNLPTFNVEFIDSKSDVFDDSCNIFKNEEKNVLLEFCKKTGCSDPYLKGFGDCGIMVSFQHGCPNNSIPVLWYDRKQWITLFERRCI
jgi:hypothetical protein